MARYFRRGVSKFKFCPAVTSLAAPSRSEITAGKDLSPQVAEVAGWEYTNSPIDTPDFATTFTPQIGGEDKAAASSFTLYDDDTTTTLRTGQAKGTSGFMILFPLGDVPTKRCEVWPCVVTSISDRYVVANEAAKYHVQYSITARPEQAAVIPT